METKTIGKILFGILILFGFFNSEIRRFTSTGIYITIFIIILALAIYFEYWLNKNTEFYKKPDSFKGMVNQRVNVYGELGFFSIAVVVLYILGIVAIGFGIASIVDGYPGQAIVMFVLGLVVITVGIFMNRWKKNYYKKDTKLSNQQQNKSA